MEGISAYLGFSDSALHVLPQMARAWWSIWLLRILLQYYRPSSSKLGLVSMPSTVLEHVWSYYTVRLSLKKVDKGIVQEWEGPDLSHKWPEWRFADYQHSDKDTGADRRTGKWFAYIRFRPTLARHSAELILITFCFPLHLHVHSHTLCDDPHHSHPSPVCGNLLHHQMRRYPLGFGNILRRATTSLDVVRGTKGETSVESSSAWCVYW